MWSWSEGDDQLLPTSVFIAACPRLTELTISPYPHHAKITETEILLDPAGTSRSAMLELVIACGTLPDFGTLQILHFPTAAPYPICWCGHHGPSKEQWEQASREQTGVMKDLAMVTLKNSKTEGKEGKDGRKKTTVRVVELTRVYPRVSYDPGYVKVEEYEV